MDVKITLTDEQVKAIRILNLENETQDICEKAIATSLRGKFKYYAEKAENETAKSYDWAANNGATFSLTREEFVSQYMKEIREMLYKL